MCSSDLPSPNIEKPNEGGEVRENPPVVVESGVRNGEKKPDYKGSVDYEKSAGGNWVWRENKQDWFGASAGGSFVIDMSDINFDD